MFLFGIFWFFLNYAERQILEQVLNSLEQALLSGNPDVNSLENVSVHLRTTYVLVFAGMLAVMGVLLYFLAGITLRPIRKNMEGQRRFIADVSHELRTPLSVMKAEAEVALLEGSDDKDRKNALRGNIEEINRISIIINNLISFTHVNGLTASSFASVDIHSVINRSVEKLYMPAKKAGVQVEVNCTNGTSVWGNEIALEQAVINLLKNAIAHTPPGGSVKISVSEVSSGQIRLQVKDTGTGIPPEDLEKIFEPFFKSGKSENAKRGSVGLGLALVKEIVRSHKGKLQVESTLGEGATFNIFLPVGTT
ncbi:MAG TPA: HAMP domain-containing sensor histidine kinase [Candidatus Paceibacterota bacterium]|nr:HAMP domain-containing sensor histidine kinase [Candidatus Paceibacterota bacterium]